ALPLPGLAVSHWELDVGETDVDAFLHVLSTKRSLRLIGRFANDVVEPAVGATFFKVYRSILEQTVSDPQPTAHNLVTAESPAIPGEATGPAPQDLLAISASFTAEPIAESISFWNQKLGLGLRVEFAPYHQVFQQLLDLGGLLRKNDRGANVLLLRFEDYL